jgi:hypothetical protein
MTTAQLYSGLIRRGLCIAGSSARSRSEPLRVHRVEYEESAMSSVVKKRRKKMRKHKHRKMLKKTRWQRKHKG